MISTASLERGVYITKGLNENPFRPAPGHTGLVEKDARVALAWRLTLLSQMIKWELSIKNQEQAQHEESRTGSLLAQQAYGYTYVKYFLLLHNSIPCHGLKLLV